MRISVEAFDRIADEIVDPVMALASAAEVEFEIYICIQEIPDPGSEERLAYVLRSDSQQVFLVTDRHGRMWYCDCSTHQAQELGPETNCTVISAMAADSLGIHWLAEQQAKLH